MLTYTNILRAPRAVHTFYFYRMSHKNATVSTCSSLNSMPPPHFEWKEWRWEMSKKWQCHMSRCLNSNSDSVMLIDEMISVESYKCNVYLKPLLSNETIRTALTKLRHRTRAAIPSCIPFQRYLTLAWANFFSNRCEPWSVETTYFILKFHPNNAYSLLGAYQSKERFDSDRFQYFHQNV